MIKNPNFFDQSLPADFSGLFDWDLLSKAVFPRFSKENFMDIDAVMEKNGRFLHFETKSKHSVIPIGQQITINAYIDTGLVTYIYILFETEDKNLNKISKIYVKYPNDEKTNQIVISKMSYVERFQKLIDICIKWRKDAENKGRLTIKEKPPVTIEKIIEIKCECWYCKLRRMILNYI